MDIYRLSFTNYNDSSEPYFDRFTKITKKNLEDLKKKCVEEFKSEIEDMHWDHGKDSKGFEWWSYNDDDCLYGVISVEHVWLNADGTDTMETE